MAIFPRERIDFGRLGLPVAHLSRDQRDLLELLVTLHQQGRARQRRAFLAAEMKCSARTISRRVKELVELGEIRVEGGNGDVHLYGPADGKQLYWTAPEERGSGGIIGIVNRGEDSADDQQGLGGFDDTSTALSAGGEQPVENPGGPGPIWQGGVAKLATVPLPTTPPDTPSSIQSMNEGSGAHRISGKGVDRWGRPPMPKTSRVERNERARQSSVTDPRTGLLLRKWDPAKPWFSNDRRTPQRRVKEQVIHARREGTHVWVYSRRDQAYRCIVDVSISTDDQYMTFQLEPLDAISAGRGEVEVRGPHPTIGTTTLLFYTDRWGNKRN